MYAAMAFLAKIASDYRKPNCQFAIMPDLGRVDEFSTDDVFGIPRLNQA